MPINSNEQQMKSFYPFLNYQNHQQVQLLDSSIKNNSNNHTEIHIIEDTYEDRQNCISEPIEVPDMLSESSRSDQISLTYRSTPNTN